VTERWAYLNHAGTGVLPTAAVEAMRRAAAAQAERGSLALNDHEAAIERVRADAAALLGVPSTDVAFVKNTTEGLGFVANGLEWRDGDRVVVPDLEFPSTVYPWLALRDRGVIVDLVPPRGPGRALPLDAFAEVMAAGPVPRVVATSWVQWSRGWRTDLAALGRLCADAGALLCADVIQGVGVLPADLEAWGVDFAITDAQKWMLGPEGIGVLYVRRSCLDLLRPLEPGWNSMAHRDAWEDTLDVVWDDDARRLEGGTPNTAGTLAMGAALDILHDAGIEAVWRHVDALCDRLAAGLTAVDATILSDRSPGGRSGIVSFVVDGATPDTVVEHLRTAGIVCAARAGGIRVAPHGYNTEDEVDAVVEAVARFR